MLSTASTSNNPALMDQCIEVTGKIEFLDLNINRCIMQYNLANALFIVLRRTIGRLFKVEGCKVLYDQIVEINYRKILGL
jgi:hypothetical protein